MSTPTNMTSSLSLSRCWRSGERSGAGLLRAGWRMREGKEGDGGVVGMGGWRDLMKLVEHLEKYGRKGRKVDTNARRCFVVLTFIMRRY